MNFWTFMDRNANGIGLLICILAAMAFLATGTGEGCKIRIQTSDDADAGP